MEHLHEGEGLEGNYCKVYLVPYAAIDIAHPNHEFLLYELQVAGTFATEDTVTFRLERTNFFSRNAPQDRFVAARCRWGFGSDECGYIINAVPEGH